MKKVSLVPDVVVEEVGNGLLVMVPGSQDVLSLSGRAAEVVRSVQSGVSVAEDSAVAELAGLGVVEVSGVSRRGLIKAGAIGAGAGIAVLAMPGVAAASSGPEKLLGFIVVDAWDATDNDPDLNLKLGAQTGDGVAAIFATSPVPYESIPPLGTAIEGTVQSGGATYTAYLIDYLSLSSTSDPIRLWMFKAQGSVTSPPIRPGTGEAFTLTFIFEGVTYTMINDPNPPVG